MTLSLASSTDSVLRRLLETEQERRRLVRGYDWETNARTDQRIPAGDWRIWCILAGRGWGKTRTGAEAIRTWSENFSHLGLIAPTKNDAREIMVEGVSGILAVFPPERKPRYIANRYRIEFPSGSVGTVFTADEPDRLRGPQHTKLWADELAVWRYPEAWDMAMLGLRLGKSPQAIITTTPKPTKLIREIRDRSALDLDPLGKIILTRGSTYDNEANLSPAFLSEIIRRYHGTRLGRQEIEAEIIEDVPGALWSRSMIDYVKPAQRMNLRTKELTFDLSRVVVAIDPAVTSGEDSDETGIVAAGVAPDGVAYVLADASCKVPPADWAKRAINLYHELQADLIVAEANNGGDLVSTVIHAVDPRVPVALVHAARGKRTRAEPVSALYEQERVFHVEPFARLEDQMCSYSGSPGEDSPDRMDALVWALTEVMDISTDATWGSGGVWGGNIAAGTA